MIRRSPSQDYKLPVIAGLHRLPLHGILAINHFCAEDCCGTVACRYSEPCCVAFIQWPNVDAERQAVLACSSWPAASQHASMPHTERLSLLAAASRCLTFPFRSRLSRCVPDTLVSRRLLSLICVQRGATARGTGSAPVDMTVGRLPLLAQKRGLWLIHGTAAGTRSHHRGPATFRPTCALSTSIEASWHSDLRRTHDPSMMCSALAQRKSSLAVARDSCPWRLQSADALLPSTSARWH